MIWWLQNIFRILRGSWYVFLKFHSESGCYGALRESAWMGFLKLRSSYWNLNAHAMYLATINTVLFVFHEHFEFETNERAS